MSVKFIDGQSIYLRPLEKEDLKGNYSLWLNDPKINELNSHCRFVKTQNELNNYIESVSSSKSELVLAVVYKQNDLHVGNISLQSINWLNRDAEIAFILGEVDYWGKGIMYEAGKLLLSHAFKKLNLHRIHCGTSINNLGMIRLAKKLGMKQEGIRREALFNNGKYFDIVEFGIINKKIKNI